MTRLVMGTENQIYEGSCVMKLSLCGDQLQLTFTTAASQMLCSCRYGVPPDWTRCLFPDCMCFIPTSFTAWKHLGGQRLQEPLANDTVQGLTVRELDRSQSRTQMELGTGMGFSVPAAKLLPLSSSLMQLLPKLQVLARKQNLKMKLSLCALSLFSFIKSWRQRAREVKERIASFTGRSKLL